MSVERNKFTSIQNKITSLAKKDPKAFETLALNLTQKLIKKASSEELKERLAVVQKRINTGKINFRRELYTYCLYVFEEFRENMIMSFISSLPPDERESLKKIKMMIAEEKQDSQRKDLNFSNFILLIGLPWDKFINPDKNTLSFKNKKSLDPSA